jgi:DNA uptake protein ComE-like DNA-binding protein
MKNIVARFSLTVLSLLLAASLSFAADAKKAEKKAETKPAAEKTAAAPKDAAKKDLVDLNSATEAELKAVAGIGDTYASKIVAGRPYANKAQLKSRNILPGPVYEKVKDQIIAKQPPKEAGKDAAAKPAAKDAKAKPAGKDAATESKTKK